MAVVGAFVRFSRTAVVRRNELQFASKASHHRRAPSTWEGGRARTAQVFLSMHFAIANRRFKRIGVTTKLCFEVHQPNLTAEAACLRSTYRHHPIIPKRANEGGRVEGFFLEKRADANSCAAGARPRSWTGRTEDVQFTAPPPP